MTSFPTFFASIALALGLAACGGEETAAPAPELTTERRQVDTAPPPPPGEVPRPVEGPSPAPALAPGAPLTVQTQTVEASAPSDSTAPPTATLTPHAPGIVRVELAGLRSYCDPEPALLAHVDGTTLRLHAARPATVSRCVRPYRVTAFVGPLAAGTYDVELGQPSDDSSPVPLGEVVVSEPAAEADAPPSPLAVSQRPGEVSPGDLGVVEAVAGAGVVRVTLRAALPCTGGEPVLLGASLADGILRLRPHAPSRVARCPSLRRTYTLVVVTGEATPERVELTSISGQAIGEPVALGTQ